jgi:protein-S-isoprenylcysteine O-methyltransferase Ste14
MLTFDYGFWDLVVINSLIFIVFAFSFFRPKNLRDWRTFGAFAAFIIALFTEMYGLPLSIFLVSGVLQSKFPESNLLSHDSGHLWYVLFGFEGDPHANPIHIASNLMLLLGFILLGTAWVVLHNAQKKQLLAKTGLYAWVRHPQYIAFALIMFSFLLMWPTFPTLLMFPFLLFMYFRLAKKEEKIALNEFSEEYQQYKLKTPAFWPRLKNISISQILIAIVVCTLTVSLMWWPLPIALIVLTVLLIGYNYLFVQNPFWSVTVIQSEPNIPIKEDSFPPTS